MFSKNLDSENETPQSAKQNTLNQSHARAIYEPSSEHTISTTKTSDNFFKTKERPNGDIFWNGISVKNIGGLGLQISESEYDTRTVI